MHTSSGAVSTTADLGFTIDAQGHPEAVFIFQVKAALAFGANTTINLIGGAQAKNVFWQVNGAGGIGAGNDFVGTLMANGAISSGEGSVINGRLLTKTGAIAMANNDVYSAPPSVSIVGGAAVSTAVSDPSISGTTSVVAPASVTVTIDGVTQADQPVPNGVGVWSLTLDGLLANDDHTVVASVTDGAGNIGTFTQVLTVAATEPTLFIDGDPVVATADQTPTVSGTSTRVAGQIIEFTLTRTNPPLVLIRTAIVQANGTWNVTPNGFTGGEWTILAAVNDPAGNTATASQVLTIDTVYAITSSALTKDSTPVITGTVESGSAIAVDIDGLAFTVTQDDAPNDTVWSATTTSEFANGSHPVLVTATDGAGDRVLEQTLTIDLVGPLMSIDGGATSSTDDAAAPIVGSTNAAVGTQVNVGIDGASPLTAVVQPNGSWRVTPSVDLAPGAHTIVATVADPAGNVGTFTQTLTVNGAAFVQVAAVPLGLTEAFGAMTPNAAFTSTGPTTFRGDTGSTTYAFVGGGHDGESFIAPAYAAAYADLEKAYSNAEGRPAGTTMKGNISGETFGPGVHTSVGAVSTTAGTAGVPTDITIDAQGHPDAVFIFQVKAALALGANTRMLLVKGAQAKNVFWQVNGAGGIGAGSTFVGTLIANGAISSGEASVVNGRLLTKTGAVAMANNNLFSGAPSVEINGGTAIYSTVSAPTISGVTSAASVTVTIDGVEQADQPVPDGGGAWALTVTGDFSLSDGEHTIVASVTDGGGNAGSFTQIMTVDTVHPVVTIDPGATDSTNDVTPTITGTTDAAGQPVAITFSRPTPTLNFTRTTISQADKTWNFTPSLNAGEWTVVANVADSAGNTGTSTQVLTIAADPPAVAITSSALTNDPTPTITGTTDAGATIAVAIGDVVVTDIAQGTAWSATPTNAFADGEHTVSVTATDEFGNATTVTQSLTVDSTGPVVAITSGGLTADSTPTISGTTEAGATIEVSINGVAVTGVAVDGTGWSVTATNPLLDGDHNVSVTATDVAGNATTVTQNLVVDTTGPVVAITSSGLTDDSTPTISGTTEAGATIAVSIDGVALTGVLVGGTGWSVTATEPLANGDHNVSVTAADAVGNTATATQTLTVDRTPPAVLIEPGDTNATNDLTPTIAGATDVAVGQSVGFTLTLAGQPPESSLRRTVIVQDGGIWDFTPTLSAGVWTILAEVTDPAGNVGSFTQTLTVDESAPAVAIMSSALTNDSTPTVSGTTDADTTIAVRIDGIALTGIVLDGTSWSATSTRELVDGNRNVSVTATDPVGNTATVTQTLTIDLVVPEVSIDGGQTFSTNIVDPTTIGGTFGAEAVQSFTVTVTNAESGNIEPPSLLTVLTDQNWEFDQFLSDGVWTIVAEVEDAAGNIGSFTQTLTIDATPPVVVITSSGLTNDSTPTIEGTTEAGAKIAVTIDGVESFAAQGGTDWFAQGTGELADGNHIVYVTATDSVGNTATATQTLTVDLTPPAVLIDPGDANATNDLTPTISGETDVAVGNSVRFTLALADAVPEFVLVRTAIVQNGGAWDFTPTLSAGVWTISAEVSDPAGNVGSFTQILTIDTTPPDVAITSSQLTNDSTPTVSGATDADASIAVSIDGIALTGIVLDGTSWSATATSALANGNHNVSVTATDPVGNTATVTQTLTVDLVLPEVSIDGGATSSTNTVDPIIVGTFGVDAVQAVAVTITDADSGILELSGIAVLDGQDWTFDTTLSEGVWTIVAEVEDAAGNVGSFTQTLTINTTLPVVAITSSALTNDSTPTIEGTASASNGRVLTVSISTQTLIATVANGEWSVTATTLGDGLYNVTASVGTDDGAAAASAQSLTIDTVAPDVMIGNGASSVSTTDPTPAISGSGATPGSVVSVTVEGQTMTATVGSDGTWTVTPPNPLSPGDHVVTVTITDPAGNIATGTQTLTVVSVATTIAINGGTNDATNDSTPTISGSTNAADGRKIIVNVAGQTMTVAAAFGSWAVTATDLADGTYTVTAMVSTDDGTPGSAIQLLTIDTTAPVVVVDSVSTTDPTPAISGCGVTPGSMVTVYVEVLAVEESRAGSFERGSQLVVAVDGQTMTTTVGSDGTWSVTPPRALSAGVHVATITITDPAGNIGSGTQMITVVFVETTIEINGGADAATRDTTPTISGSASDAEGRLLTVTVGTQTLITEIADGVWSVTAATLADGLYRATASVGTDDGTPAASSQALTIDTVAPVVVVDPTVETTDSTPEIVGDGATPGSKVAVTIDGQTMTTIVGSDGTWSVSPPRPLSPGEHVATITITDPAGNTSTVTQVITVIALPSNGFNPVGPLRVFDTRVGNSPDALRAVAKLPVSGGYVLEVQMTDLGGYVPGSGVGAVSLNVTSTRSSAAGFITVYACGARESVSSVNFAAATTVANAVIAPVSADGTVCFYASSPTDILVDINGWYAAGESFSAVGPKRVFDTRPGSSPGAVRDVTKTKLAANTMMEVRLTDLAGLVPGSGVGAVSLNVTVSQPEADGYITVYSCDTRTAVSSVNFVAGQTVANAVIASVSSAGTVCFYSPATTDLIVDINGWFAAGEAFNAVGPKRVLDTRPGNSPDALRDVSKTMLAANTMMEVQLTDLAGYVPGSGVSAVSLNVIVTGPKSAGFITVYSCDTRTDVSSLNYAAGQTVANAVTAPVSSTGTVCFYTPATTDLVVDINGWFSK